MEKEERYRYCSVRPKDMERTYSYISDEDIGPGSYVLVPFGWKNRLCKGVVEDVGLYTAEDAPYPVEKTKRILRMLTEEEYNAPEDEAWNRYAETFADDLEELGLSIHNQDYDAVFQWAEEHQDCLGFSDIMETVVQSYRLCADHGHPGAALNLGAMYYNGTYVKRDYKQAVRYYEQAADGGEIRAICNLGYCWYYGRHQEADYEKAYYYFHLGAILFDDANCLYKLGDMYREGLCVAKNGKYAVMLYFRALEMVNRPDMEDYCRPDILLRLGDAFLEGVAVDQDAKKALDCYLQALSGFYARRKVDPYAPEMIDKAKEKIEEAEEALDEEDF